MGYDTFWYAVLELTLHKVQERGTCRRKIFIFGRN
jgi:hypothetical protein